MLEAGKVLQNRYVVEKQIGAGGMGTVYLATDKRLASPVAIKETLFTDDDLQRAFEREAQLLNSLRHPALPRVIDYFAEGDAQFLVMEYIAGEDLSAALKINGAFPVKDVMQWADELLDALDYLHTQKTPVIHRDIKPQNLKLTPEGEIILLDFGLAKGTAGDTSKVTKSNSVFGYSRSYAPLEQIQGTGTDPRSDLYSLSATLYHLMTGKSPVDALTRATAYVSNHPDPLVPADKLNSQIPPAVAQALHKGLELNAALRPQTAEAMRETFQRAVNSPAVLVNNDVKDEEATEISAKKPIPQVVPLAVPPVNAENLPSPLKIPIQPSHQNKADEVFYVDDESPRRSSWAKPAGIAAAILILGGGGAAWYANNQSTAGQSSNSTQNANVAVSKKAENTNANIKTAASNANSQANVQANAQASTQTVTEQKTADSANKNTAAKPPATSAGLEKPVVEEPSETAPAPTPIVVGNAPPTKEIEKDGEKEEPEIIEDNSDDSEDRRNRRRRGRDRRDDRPSDTRERRVNDNSSGQRLPIILGAPPN